MNEGTNAARGDAEIPACATFPGQFVDHDLALDLMSKLGTAASGDIPNFRKDIRFGSQVADGIRIKVTGFAHELGRAAIEAETGCLGDSVLGGAGGAIPAPAPEGGPLSCFRRI